MVIRQHNINSTKQENFSILYQMLLSYYRNLFVRLGMSQLSCVNNTGICHSRTVHAGTGSSVGGRIRHLHCHSTLGLLVTKKLRQIRKFLLAFATLKNVFLLHCKQHKIKFNPKDYSTSNDMTTTQFVQNIVEAVTN